MEGWREEGGEEGGEMEGGSPWETPRSLVTSDIHAWYASREGGEEERRSIAKAYIQE